MALTDTAIRGAKPKAKLYKLADEKGLHLLVNPSGEMLWRLKYRVHGTDARGEAKRVEKLLSLGSYPEISLKVARALRDDGRKQLAEGIDPGHAKKEAKIAAIVGAANSFSAVADEYISRMERGGRAEATIAKARWLNSLLKPNISSRLAADITPHELLAVLKKVEQAGKRETANRLRSFASRIFRYAVATARANNDPAQLLLGALTQPKVKYHPAITDPVRFGELLRAIDGYKVKPATLLALRLTPHISSGPVKCGKWKGRKLISIRQSGRSQPAV